MGSRPSDWQIWLYTSGGETGPVEAHVNICVVISPADPSKFSSTIHQFIHRPVDRRIVSTDPSTAACPGHRTRRALPSYLQPQSRQIQ